MSFSHQQKRFFTSLAVMFAAAFTLSACSHFGHHGHHGSHGKNMSHNDGQMSCSKCDKKDHEMHSAQVTTGQLGDSNFTHRSNTYFMGKINEKVLAAAKQSEVKAIINLQEADEIKWDEKGATEKMGMAYYHMPVTKTDDKYDPSTLKKIEEVYMKHHKAGDKVIVHCSSGARASAWFAYHLNTTHGDSIEKALEGARAVGLNADSEKRFMTTFKK
jgi:protein tyrosine phosphatase (PTP) superfamily phosphohydrolase (DUF442 family)